MRNAMHLEVFPYQLRRALDFNNFSSDGNLIIVVLIVQLFSYSGILLLLGLL